MEEIGCTANFLVIDRDTMAIENLTLFEKLVMLYDEQMEEYEDTYDSCARFFNVTENEVILARKRIAEAKND